MTLPLDNGMDCSASSHAASSHQHSAVQRTENYNRVQPAPVKYNCLIVDDAPVVRKMIGRVVKDIFEKIAYAANGEEAIQLISRSLNCEQAGDKIDIVFMDRCMPVKDGIEATRMIRDMGYQGVIMGVTGDALAEDVERFLKAGADKVITKPVKVGMLIELIDGTNTTILVNYTVVIGYLDFKMGRRTRKIKKDTAKVSPADVV